MRDLFAHFTDRWDGRGSPGGGSGEAVPLPLRIINVARDAALIVDEADGLLSPGEEATAWDAVLAAEPVPRLTLRGEAIDRALAAMGDFADLASKYFVGHATGVADLTGVAAQRCGFPAADVLRCGGRRWSAMWVAAPSRFGSGRNPRP